MWIEGGAWHDIRVSLLRTWEFEVIDPDVWREGLAQGLAAGAAVMPPIPRYAEFPWAASVGNANPLKLDTVFDDRYFMASSELNLLNTLLLADEVD